MENNILEIELLKQIQEKYKIELSVHLGSGWIKPVVEFLEKLEKLPYFEEIQLEQIKEKFGTLRVYWSKRPNTPDFSEAQQRTIFQLIRECEEITSKCCFFCGKPGEMNTVRRFVCVRCETCIRAQQNQKFT